MTISILTNKKRMTLNQWIENTTITNRNRIHMKLNQWIMNKILKYMKRTLYRIIKKILMQ